VQHANAQSNFGFEYDFCTFRSDDTSSFIELYYSFYQTDLKFIRSANGYQADGLIDLDIISKASNKSVINQIYKVPLAINDTSGYNKQTKLLGQINIILKKADYYFILKAGDYNDTSKHVILKDTISLKNENINSVQASSLQLASKIEKSSDNLSVFYKNQLEVTPNPSKIFGKNMSEVYYYIEFYNLSNKTLTDNYTIFKTITDLNNNEVKSGSNGYKMKNESKVEFGSFNVSDMPTGRYNLNVSLLDENGKELSKENNYFWVYNNPDTSAVSNSELDNAYLMSEYKDYSESQIQNEIDLLLYIFPVKLKEEIEKTSDIETKRRLLFKFWKGNDPNPSTTINEFKVLYFDRIKFANKNFKSIYKEGWKTDRGRIYLLYGAPSDLDRFPFESDQRAYEVWKYDKVQGGVEFDFVDLSGNGDNFALVNSTAIGELRDDNWKNKLRIK